MAASLMLPLLLIASACSGSGDEPAPPPSTAKVTRGNVTTSANGTGALQYMKEMKLNFPVSGRITELKVAAGDAVVPGQVLARIEDTEQQAALRKATDQVAKEQAVLGRIRDGNQAEGAQRDVKRARDILDSTRDQSDQIDRVNDQTIRNDERQLEFDQRDLRRLQDLLEQDRSGCPNYPTPPTIPTAVNGDDPCGRFASRREDVQDARRQIVVDQNDLKAARRKRDSDRAAQQIAIDTAQRAVTNAKSTAELAASDRPYNIDDQDASLDQAQAEVVRTQKALDATVLKALVAGRIAVVNVTIGQFVAASSGLTVIGGETDPAARPSRSDAVMVENGVNTFQVRASFNEPDALKMTPGQEAELTFDAVPGLVQKGKIATIDPVGGAAGGQGTYLVTIVFDQADPRLKDGMSTKVKIVTSNVQNVLVVPKAAVKGIGRATTVTLVAPDGTQREVPVEVGVVGDTTVEIKSGVKEGDTVAVGR